MAKQDGFASYPCLTKTMTCVAFTKDMSSCLSSPFSSTPLQQTIDLHFIYCELQKAEERYMGLQYVNHLLTACPGKNPAVETCIFPSQLNLYFLPICSYTEAAPKPIAMFFYSCTVESATPEIIRGMRLPVEALKALKMEQICVQHKRVVCLTAISEYLGH